MQSSPTTQLSALRPKRSTRWLKRLLATCIGLLLACATLEGGFRVLLFSDSELALKIGRSLRSPQLYASPDTNSDYFKLRHFWKKKHKSGQHKRDAYVGWLKRETDHNYDHQDRDKLAERRPLLLYGDSFMACVTRPEACWQGLIQKSELSKDFAVINYGVRGFGLDQIYILLDRSLDLWLDQKPVVAVGIFADDDLDRMAMDFRGGVKPIFRLKDEQLAVTYPGEYELNAWMESNPPEIQSYALNYMTVGQRWLPRSLTPEQNPGSRQLLIRKAKLTRAIVAEAKTRLESAGVDYFFVIFEGPHKRGRAAQNSASWRVQLLQNTFDRMDIPWVSSSQAMLRHQQANQLPENPSAWSSYFIPDSQTDGRHFNRAGNEIVVQALINGVNKQFDQ